MPNSRWRRIAWIKEEGLEVPPSAAMLRERGWKVHVLGLNYDRIRGLRVGRAVRLLVALWHALLVRLGIIRATLVVGVHYAGIFSALLRSIWPFARYAVVIDSLYAIPHARQSGFIYRIERQGIRLCDAVVLNSSELAEQLLAQDLVRSRERIFILRDPAPHSVHPQATATPYAFSGGSSARDWHGLADVVRATNSEVHWIIACPARTAALFANLANVEVLSNVSIEHFDSLVAGAAIVIVPLAGTHVAGVTLVRAAQAAGAFVIAYGARFLGEYITSGLDGVIARDADEAKAWVTKVWHGDSDTTAIRRRAQARIEMERQAWVDDNIRLAAFLEQIEASCRGSLRRAR